VRRRAVSQGEQCDGDALAGATCASRGFASGTLQCAQCHFDASGCSFCGNGVINGREESTVPTWAGAPAPRSASRRHARLHLGLPSLDAELRPDLLRCRAAGPPGRNAWPSGG